MVVESISKRVSQAQMKNSSGLNRRSGNLAAFSRLVMSVYFVNQEVVFLADQDFFGSLPGVELALHYL